MALFFLFTPIPLGTKSIALFGLAINVIALKREYFREKSWKRIFKIESDDPNGPAGQN
ncbi:unannotated protein [freshwater metagenome]